MEFVLVKLQTYSVQTTSLFSANFTTDSFWNMFQVLAFLKRIF